MSMFCMYPQGGRTALDIAVEKADMEIIKVLIIYQSKVWCTLDHLMNHGIIEDWDMCIARLE